MKSLVVYYSRTGLTRKVAEKLVAALGADKEEIIDKTNRSGVIGYLRSGKEAVKKTLADIELAKIDPSGYDLVVIGTPVWAANMASPVRTYLTNQKDKLKRVAFFATQGGTASYETHDNMAELVGLKSVGSLVVVSRDVANNKYQEKLDKFVKEITA